MKDEKCRDWPIDKSKLQTLEVTSDYFKIYSVKYPELTLSPEEFNKPSVKQKYEEVSRNYAELCKNMCNKLTF